MISRDMPMSPRGCSLRVLLEGTLLKPNMVTLGSDTENVTPEVVEEYTVRALRRIVPPTGPSDRLPVWRTVQGGGHSPPQCDEQAQWEEGKKPWSLFFSFRSALQQSTLKAWTGKKESIKKVRDAFLTRCKANSKATLGTYKGDVAGAEGVSESLHVKDYKS
ncbi:hypothetical protein ZIOFF_031054 [Zingiber officinale]|uniref:Fructose-bisphosphate aldolase n=1 Tax=Zingiber officinale TaxID=94328 RepID=A0A8J5GS74_ZINOF|nr:hypothetical protein ZIOFF_031054 [Zingiber officinale]